MIQLRGQLRLSDEVVLDDLDVWINLSSASEHAQHWHGQFTVPAHTPLEQGPYRLVLNDGREGELTVENWGVDVAEEATIQFIGCSPLA